MLKIFIGYDKNEPVAYHALSQSIIENSSQPVSITPLVRDTLPIGMRDLKASTDFADTRFLVPWLSNYEGWSLFIDCDMVFTFDPSKLFELKEEEYSVMVRKHDHQQEETTKFLGATQYKYDRKNWSSVMLFNNSKCKKLTPSYVMGKMEDQNGLALHQFEWCENHEIGSIPKNWNYLVGSELLNENIPYLIHYTEGTPCFEDYKDCDFSDIWHSFHESMNYSG